MLAYLDTFIGFAVVMLGASLIVTILVQVVSAAASLRGASLRWGLEQLFKNIDPDTLPTIKDNAGGIARALLTHNLTSDSIFSALNWVKKIVPVSWGARFQLASSIRSRELVGVLKQWSTQAKPPSGIPETEFEKLKEELKKLLDTKNPVAERQIALLTQTSAALGSLALDKAPALIEETVKTVRDSAGKLEAWFDTAMDRVSQQFSMYMRIWTVILSFTLAAVTGLDAIQLISSLYEKGDFRSAMVSAAPNLLTRADQILPPGAKSPDEAVASALAGVQTDAVSKALANAKVSIGTKPQGIKTRDEGVSWIRQNVPDAAQQRVALEALPGAADQAFAEFMQKNAKNASDIKDIVTAAGIQIVGGWPQGFNWRQLLGVLVSGAALSLGAPFWFNSLKALTNLRPTVASKLKEEEKKSA